MASYTNWNQALVSYFISGTPRSTKIYLSVDDEVIERIGYKFDSSHTGSFWGDDFRVAVQQRVMNDGQVNLGNLQGRDSLGFPNGVAFLCATVMAASQMAHEEKISEINYFRRLREVLGLSGSGRPPGMEPGVEEPLWKDWNSWLMEDGFLPSAHRGHSGPTTYINYPISQSLLRRTDKDRLQRLFKEKQWQAQWDAQTLFSYVCKEAAGFGNHLKDLLTKNRERHEAVSEAIHQVYEQWKQGGSRENQKYSHNWSRHLFCGLYREETFLCDINYYLYPKQQRGRKLELVEVQLGDNVQQLTEERPGWYCPLDYLVNVSELNRDTKFQITSPDDLDYLILPVRDFWILIPDPENPDSGVYATWGTPSLGIPFILLCKQELLSDIQRLRDERLIEWSGKPQPVFHNSNWVELHSCMVLSQAWDGVFIFHQALKDALQPSVRISISLSGGLRVPYTGAWLVEHSPQITIFGFYPTAELRIIRLADDYTIIEKLQITNTPIAVNFPHPGDYLVEVTCAGDSSQRFVRIVDWNSLLIEKPLRREVIPIGSGYQICGCLIEQIY